MLIVLIEEWIPLDAITLYYVGGIACHCERNGIDHVAKRRVER